MKLKSWVSMIGIAAGSMIASGSGDRVGAVTTVLYDSASGTTPNAITNPYVSFNNPDTGSSQTFISAADGTRLNTFNPTTFPFPPTAEVSRAGYSNYNNSGSFVNSAFPVLDKNAGYTLSFTVKINSQTNNGTNGANRAGFSALILGSDNTGIEIGFRNPNTQGGGTTPDIFSQSGASFTVGEQNTNISTILSQLTTYDLSVLGNSYTLKNGNNTLLAGALRDYSAAAVPNTATAVYGLSNFLFLGDNTTSAGANVDISNITLITNNSSTAVPEPSNLLGIGIAIGLGVKLKRKLQKINHRSNRLFSDLDRYPLSTIHYPLSLSDAYLLVSHGSRDPRPQIAIDRLAQQLRSSLSAATPNQSPILVATAQLELALEPLHAQISSFAHQCQLKGCDRVVILPLFLSPGVHAIEDIPAEVALAEREIGNNVKLKIAPFLGNAPNLIDLFVQNRSELPSQSIISAHGSRRAGGNAIVELLADSLNLEAAYWSVPPSLTDRITEAIAAGANQIGILPYFLFAGGITDAIGDSVAQLQQQYPQVKLILGEPIGNNLALVATIGKIVAAIDK